MARLGTATCAFGSSLSPRALPAAQQSRGRGSGGCGAESSGRGRGARGSGQCGRWPGFDPLARALALTALLLGLGLACNWQRLAPASPTPSPTATIETPSPRLTAAAPSGVAAPSPTPTTVATSPAPDHVMQGGKRMVRPPAGGAVPCSGSARQRGKRSSNTPLPTGRPGSTKPSWMRC